MTTYVVVDLEATKDSVTNEQHIIQIGMTFIENDLISDTLTIDIKPPVAISQTITQLTGITNSQVMHAPTFEDVSDYILTLLEGCVFVAHNSLFDYGLLVAEYERLNQVFPKMVCVDTIELAKILLPTQQLFGLKTLTQQYGISLDNHHNAGEDAHATAQLFLTLKQEINQLSETTCEKIYRLLYRKADDLAFLFDSKGQYRTMPLVVTSPNQVNLITQQFMVMPQFENALNNSYLSYQDFIDDDIIEYLVHHGQELSIQDSRLIARVCVYLDQSNSGNLSILRLPQKLVQRIQSYDDNNHYYLQHIAHLKTQEVVYFSAYHFVKEYALIKEHFDLSQVEVVISSTQDWIKQSRLAMTQTFSLSNWMYHLFSVKNTMVVNNQVIPAVDNALSQLFSLIDKIKEQLPPQSKELLKDREHYLGAVSESIVEQVKRVLKSIVLALDKPYKTSYTQLLDQVNISASDYMSTRVQFNEFSVRYTLMFQPFSTQEWFDKVLLSDVKAVFFDDEWIANRAFTTYFEVMVSKKSDLPIQDFEVLPRLVVKSDKNAQNWKDNLLVKKVVQFCEQQIVKTLVVVPNHTVLLAIKDAGIITVDEVAQGHLINKNDVVVATWKTVYALRSQLSEVQQIIVVKLPFEHPDSMQYQASKYYLPSRTTYFSTIDLVSVLLEMVLILSELREVTRVEIWDNRFIQSAYAKKITDIFKDIVKIVEE